MPTAPPIRILLSPGQSAYVTCELETPPPLPEPIPIPAPAPPVILPPVIVPEDVLFFEDFEYDQSDPVIARAQLKRTWNEVPQQVRLTVLEGRKCLEVNQPLLGWGGEMRKNLPPGDQLYLSFDWRINPECDLSDHTGRHFFRLGDPTGKRQVDTETDNGNFQAISFWGPEQSFWKTIPGGLPKGVWFRFGFWFRLNTVGANNGEMAIYINGVRVFHKPDMVWRTSGEQISVLRMVTNFDNASPGSYWFYDRIQVERNIPLVP